MSTACSYSNYNRLLKTNLFNSLSENCQANYSIIPFFDLFHRGWPMWVLIIIAVLLIPLSFLNLKLISDDFMSHSILNLKTLLRMSSLIASITLVPLSNIGPDIIVSFLSSSKKNGADISVSALVGAFVFVASVVLGYVVYVSPNKEVKVPRAIIIKDFLAYGVGILMVIGLGLIGKVNKGHALIPITLFAIYIAVSVVIAKRSRGQEGFLDLSREEQIDPPQDESINPTLWQRITGHLYDSSGHFLSVISLRFKVAYLFTVPYRSNPLMTTPYRFLLLFLAPFLAIFFFGIPVSLLGVFIGCLIFAGIMALLITLTPLRRHSDLVFDFLCLVASVGWMKLCSAFLLDGIYFLSFCIGVGQNLLTMIVVAIGSSVSDLFSAGAIATTGSDVMALLGMVSTQVFNLFLSKFLSLLFTVTTFDIFGLHGADQVMDKNLLIILLLFGFGVIAINILHVVVNGAYQKSFFCIALVFYISFAGILIANTIFSMLLD